MGQDGQLVLQSGAVADDRFLGSMKFYVKVLLEKFRVESNEQIYFIFVLLLLSNRIAFAQLSGGLPP